ncbi:hypothetical protein [Marispirochaeta sp.]|uniref:hypothetical protein n=1 Tax=Marispirochaeta sp. TaxID=2038653 RepID=UPI0029C7E13A|nr:hypothetical protein [Marispirochaeta sp.]
MIDGIRVRMQTAQKTLLLGAVASGMEEGMIRIAEMRYFGGNFRVRLELVSLE